jgi:hypothetical protein
LLGVVLFAVVLVFFLPVFLLPVSGMSSSSPVLSAAVRARKARQAIAAVSSFDFSMAY